MENLKMLSGKDKKKSVKRVYNTKNNSITTKGQSLYEASAQFLSSIIDTNQASYHLLLDNKKMPHVMIVHRGLCYFIEIMNGRKQLPVSKEETFASLERAGAKLVICRSTQALVLTLQHWNIPMVFDWRV